MRLAFARLSTIVTDPSDEGGAIGGFALLCSLLYIIVAALWPVLLVLGGGEPEGLFLSMFFAPPAFLGANIFGIAGLLSGSARNRLLSIVSLCGAWALTLGIAVIVVWVMYTAPPSAMIIDFPAPFEEITVSE